jgi:flagellin
MTTINTNIAAMTAANSIKTNDRSMAVAMERLSTGLRINSASDDAAGLAISTKMTSQIRGLDAAARNANDAISMIQVADGAASEITDMLQRMRELTVQSSNGVNSTTDRANLDQEFVQLALAIDKIAETTEFNGRKILNGDADGAGDSTVTFQVGANSGANEQLDVNFSDFNLAAGGSTAPNTFAPGSGSSAAVNVFTLDVTTLNAGDVVSLGDVSYTVTGSETDNTAVATALGATAGYTGSSSGSASVTLTATVDGVGTTLGDLNIATNPMAAVLTSFSGTGIDENAFATTLNLLDGALEGVASQRATFGAAVNTLEHTVDNLVTTSGNQSAARSQILDADYAAETTALARTQIISQAGTAMLSQANQAAQGVLALLR